MDHVTGLSNEVSFVLLCHIIPADYHDDRAFLPGSDSFNITEIYLIIMLLLYSINKRVISDRKLSTTTAQS